MFFTETPFKAVELVDAYRAGGIYPEERLAELVMRFTDVRLQLEYLGVDAGLANQHYYGPIGQTPALVDSPRLKLTLMAIDQSVIGRSRVGWEKLSRAVYYLETGNDLVPTGSGSFKKKFFDWVSGQEKWRFLEPYKSVVTNHDDRFRTGEYHKGSVLRARILGRVAPAENDLLALSNHMRNGIWLNVLDIVGEGWASRFTDLHAPPGEDGGIDLKYLPPDPVPGQP